MNYSIDFIPIHGPYSSVNWAMLYTFGVSFKTGVLISIN